MSFEDSIRKASEVNKSRTILALDLGDASRQRLITRCKEILERVHEYICAVKINRQLVLSLGLNDGVDAIIRSAHDFYLPAIMDAKLNDVGHTNEFMTRSYLSAGFDAVIASPVVGWENGLDRVFELASSQRKSILLLVYMSNPGADAFYSLMAARGDERPRPVFELLTEKAIQWNAKGVVVGATKPEIIARVRELAGPNLAIYSPGVGPQGGDGTKALMAGANYLIVGRAIYATDDPAKAAKQFRDLTA